VKIRKRKANPGKCSRNRRHLLKIPLITTGFMLGAMAIPPWMQTADAAGGEFDTKIEGAVRIGFWNLSLPVPAFFINREVGAGIKRAQNKVRQFSDEKRAVHHFVVRELPRQGKPLALESIARGLTLPLEKVARLVNELEQAKTFLYRKNSDRIDWAYPVTVDDTPHKVTFSTGEKVNSA
jgi:hypothetical protein